MNYSELSAYAASIESDYPDKGQELWTNSPFAWIRKISAATKHTVGTRFIQRILEDAGVASIKSGKGLIAGKREVAVKYSMEWEGGGFVFEQFRATAPEFIFCLGIEPTAAYGWIIPKSEIISQGVWQEREGLRGQHKGAAANDTRWLSVSPLSPPDWLTQYGGTLERLKLVATTILT